MSEWWSISAWIGGFLAGVFLLIFSLAAICAHAFFPVEVAQVEQLRHDAALVTPATAEDVVGQVVEVNMQIVAARSYNRMFPWGIATPDGWDDVELIPVPEAQP